MSYLGLRANHGTQKIHGVKTTVFSSNYTEGVRWGLVFHNPNGTTATVIGMPFEPSTEAIRSAYQEASKRQGFGVIDTLVDKCASL